MHTDVFYWGLAQVNFTHFIQGLYTGTGAFIALPLSANNQYRST